MCRTCGDLPSVERLALLDAETMLLVDDRDREVRELDALLDQRMRADDDVRIRSEVALALPGELVSSAQVTPRRLQGTSSVRKCCSASVSVGAINAPCLPASTARNKGVERDDGFARIRPRPEGAAASARCARGRRRGRRSRAPDARSTGTAGHPGSARPTRRAGRAPVRPPTRARGAGARARSGAATARQRQAGAAPLLPRRASGDDATPRVRPLARATLHVFEVGRQRVRQTQRATRRRRARAASSP